MSGRWKQVVPDEPMTAIPKRPDFDATWRKPEPGMTPERWQIMRVAHEHAVAVRAVEALELLERMCESATPWKYSEEGIKAPVEKALADVRAAGWRK